MTWQTTEGVSSYKRQNLPSESFWMLDLRLSNKRVEFSSRNFCSADEMRTSLSFNDLGTNLTCWLKHRFDACDTSSSLFSENFIERVALLCRWIDISRIDWGSNHALSIGAIKNITHESHKKFSSGNQIQRQQHVFSHDNDPIIYSDLGI